MGATLFIWLPPMVANTKALALFVGEKTGFAFGPTKELLAGIGVDSVESGVMQFST